MTDGELGSICPYCGGNMKPTGEVHTELREALGDGAQYKVHREKYACDGEGCLHADWRELSGDEVRRRRL